MPNFIGNNYFISRVQLAILIHLIYKPNQQTIKSWFFDIEQIKLLDQGSPNFTFKIMSIFVYLQLSDQIKIASLIFSEKLMVWN